MSDSEPPERPSASDLVRAALAGDLMAWNAIAMSARVTGVHVGRKMFGNEYDAEDLGQDTACVVHSKLKTLKEPDALFGWINRIATNLALKRLRRRHREIPCCTGDIAGLERVLAPPDDRLPDLRRLIAALPEEQFEVLMMKKVLGASWAEIAAHQEKSIATVRSRLRLANERLKPLRSTDDEGP